MTDIAALVKRIEAGETGWQINMDVDWLFSDYVNIGGGWRQHKATGERERYNYGAGSPPVSTSLDACTALVERVMPGAHWDLHWYPGFEIQAGATLLAAVPSTPVSARAPTPAAALLAALLKAKESE